MNTILFLCYTDSVLPAETGNPTGVGLIEVFMP